MSKARRVYGGLQITGRPGATASRWHRGCRDEGFRSCYARWTYRAALAFVIVLLLWPCASLRAEAPERPRPGNPSDARLEDQWKAKLNANTISIIAGSPSETYLDITSDLATVVKGDNLRVLPIVGLGGAQNIRDVLYLKGIDLGLTTSRMLRYFASTGELSSALDQRLGYITRLFLEEMHVLVVPNVTTIEDLAGKKVNFSDDGSATQITARDVFGLLSIHVDEVNMGQIDAIAKLKTGEIAGTVLISGKPVSTFSHISPDDHLHLLPIPYTPTLENTYVPGQLESALYPGLIANGTNVPTIAVDSVLITNNWQPSSERYGRISRFVNSFFSRFSELRKPPRHPKWLEVNLGADLPGWDRFPPAQEWLEREEHLQSDYSQERFYRFLARQAAPSSPAMREETKQELFREFLEWSAGRQD